MVHKIQIRRYIFPNALARNTSLLNDQTDDNRRPEELLLAPLLSLTD